MMHDFEFTSQILEQHGTNIIVLTLNYVDFEISTSAYSVFFSAQKQRTSRTSCIYRGSEENNTQLHCGALSAAFKINFGICIDFQSGVDQKCMMEVSFVKLRFAFRLQTMH